LVVEQQTETVLVVEPSESALPSTEESVEEEKVVTVQPEVSTASVEQEEKIESVEAEQVALTTTTTTTTAAPLPESTQSSLEALFATQTSGEISFKIV
jgi:hypothetical protein